MQQLQFWPHKKHALRVKYININICFLDLFALLVIFRNKVDLKD